MRIRNLFLALALMQVPSGSAPPIARPAYPPGKGPIVAIDEAHKNTHHARDGMQGMVRLLERDGYRIRTLADPISHETLKGIDTLVIAQPGGWEGPAASLTHAEVKALLAWVRAGGSLLLILDHMPAPANGAALASAFGVPSWHNGYAMVEVPDSLQAGRIVFRGRDYPDEGQGDVIRTGAPGGPAILTYHGADAVLTNHPIIEGRGADERVRWVMTFVGSAFVAPGGAEPLLVMPRRAVSLMPENTGAADVRGANVPAAPIGGWLQGAALKIGKGRVALFGEVGLFSGQWPVHVAASENYKLILNVMHWLSGIL